LRVEGRFRSGRIELRFLDLLRQAGASRSRIARFGLFKFALALFRGAGEIRVFENRQNLALLEFYDYYQASATGAGSVLLAYAEESPAMAALHHGLGTLLLLNFSAGELSSNLARQRLFPAWVQDLVKALSADEPAPASYTIGETLHTEVWRSEMRDQDFRAPSGAPLTVRRQLTGERYAVSFTPDQLGFYTLGAPRPLYAFGINTSPDEADLRPIDKDALPMDFAAEHGRDRLQRLPIRNTLPAYELRCNALFSQPVRHGLAAAARGLPRDVHPPAALRIWDFGYWRPDRFSCGLLPGLRYPIPGIGGFC
jgi:hypothetical protein